MLERTAYSCFMRLDNKNPQIVYENFGDWLLNYRDHLVFALLLFFGYWVYLATTTETRQ